MKFLREHKTLVYALACLLEFGLLPLLIHDTGSAIVLMLIVLPAVTILLAGLFGFFGGKCRYALLLPCAVFAATLFLFYNSTAWVYIFVHGVLGLVGWAIGRWIGK